MIKLAKLFSVLAFVTFSVENAAADVPGWISNADIDFITVQPNGRIYLRLKVAVPDLNCPGNSFGYLEFDTDAPHFKEQYSLILAAHLAGKQVTVYVENCGHFPYVQNSRVN